ncbi:MAG: KpsF/GutQ family sugar-phosphate isomerase [Deltaproteobacteria bacterium]|nr:KpsF/GutQ family sugar-phosphate isomerase [Deltaproteobacteria bacterium]
MVLDDAREVLKIEAQGILSLIPKLTLEFEKAVEAIYQLQGRVILTGIGKAGIVARKITATLNSTGTPALFLHAGEAMHGDLGMITSQDIVLAVSNSGETDVNVILPSIKQIGAKLIAFVGNPESTLARQSDLVIDVGVEKEACPLGLAPTTSTTAALAMGDALAVALMKRRQFNHKDFKRFHPGGNLGERLSVKVSEVMLTGEKIPKVFPLQSLSEAIQEMDAKDLGTALVVEENQLKLVGILTDGDLRRLLKRKTPFEKTLTGQVMTPDPKSVSPEVLASEALQLMEQYLITILPIVDKEKRVLGIVHLHDLLGKVEYKVKVRE